MSRPSPLPKEDQSQCFSTEERRTSGSNVVVGVYSPGFTRIIEMARDRLVEHDLSFKDHDPEKVQVAFSLLLHHNHVGLSVGKVGVHRGWTEKAVRIGIAAGMLHDLGKLHPACADYRKKVGFSLAKRHHLTSIHPNYSVEYIKRLKRYMRVEDHADLELVMTGVQYHHAPYMIKDPELREIAYCLKVVDTWVAMQENRHGGTPGMRTANIRLKNEVDYVREDKDGHLHVPHLPLIESVKATIIKHFDFSIEELAT